MIVTCGWRTEDADPGWHLQELGTPQALPQNLHVLVIRDGPFGPLPGQSLRGRDAEPQRCAGD